MLTNLKKAIEEKYNGLQIEASKAMGMDPGNLSTLIETGGTKRLRKPTIAKIAKGFPEYNLDWILLNKGDKLKKKPGALTASDSKGEYAGYPAPADMGTYDTKYSEPAKYKSEPNNINRVSIQNGNYNMYMVPLKAYGGFLSGYESNVYKESLEKISFPLVRGECFAFEIEGFSMVPNFKPGDWFIGSRLEGFDWLVKNRPYVFVTVNGIILKIFNEIKDEYAHLSSTNEEYNPVKPMHLKEIKGIFHKEATVRL